MTGGGDRYGKLIVISFAGYHVIPSGYKFKKWRCRCDCGNEKEILQHSLRAGTTLSCGCYQKTRVPCKRLNARGLRVGCDREHPNYNVWSMMIQRCYEDQHDSYVDYGGKGISICPRWLESAGKGFLNFIEDMGMRPDGLTLDRIDNNGNYEPANCRWADSSDQVRDRGMNKNNTSGKTGVTWCKNKQAWQAQISVAYENFVLGYFDSLQEAVECRRAGELKHFGKYSNT